MMNALRLNEAQHGDRADWKEIAVILDRDELLA